MLPRAPLLFWRVFNRSGTTLELEPIGSTTAPADLASVNCGGGVIKRSDIRLSYVRMHAAKRLRVEQTPKPATALAESSPVTVANTPAVTVSSGTVTTVTTLNATTAGLNIQNCRSVQLVLNLGAATTPPAIQLEGSDDGGTTYYALGSPLTGTASATVQTTVNNVQAGLLRARVSTAGATVTAGYLLIKGF